MTQQSSLPPTTSGPEPTDRKPQRDSQTSRTGTAWFYGLLRRLHFYAGILVGPFILIAAISGGLYALSPQLEKVVYSHVLTSSATAEQLPLAEQVKAAEAYVGKDAKLKGVRPAPEPGATTRVLYTDPKLGESESRAIFVDPTTAQVKGDLTVYGTTGALPLRTWIDQLHRNLHLGDAGRIYSELAASWLGIVVAAGLVMWAIRVRKSKRPAELLRPSRSGTGVRRTLSWHASVGVWSAVGLLFLSATGITWSQYGGENVSQLRTALGWETPAISTSASGSNDSSGGHGGHGSHGGHGGHAGHGSHSGHGGGAADAPAPAADPAGFDAVLAKAREVNVNTGLVEIRPPADAASAWVVQEIQRSFPTEVDAVAFDPATLTMTDRVDFADFNLAAKLTRWGIDLHMGTMFGLINQILLFIFAIGLSAVVLWGYVMWWQRRPRRDDAKRFGPVPKSGALSGGHWLAVTAVVLAAIAVGVLLPLVGFSLVLFIAGDLLVGAYARRRRQAKQPSS